ncbi:hypothetical protein ACIFOC_00420 [Leucobacter aridicollis]
MVVLMCQYNDRCPTTTHRPGTRCPVEVREQNRADKQREQLKGMAAVFSVMLVAGVILWFVFGEQLGLR